MEKFFYAKFLKRPNRFTVTALLDGRITNAYLPNPGRLWELLLPDTKLILEKTHDFHLLPYKVLAVERDNTPVLVDTHRTNYIVEKLLTKKLLPFLNNYSLLKKEVKFNNHRFDFLVVNNNEKHILEIKSCTLFEDNIAMFPDAVTSRGLNHVELLSELRKKGYLTHILFIVMSEKVEFFLPAYHIDIKFAEALLRHKDNIDIKAISIKLEDNLFDVSIIKELTIPWDVIKRETKNGGAYMIIYKLPEDKGIEIGELGKIYFKSGYYIYVGSALAGLEKRIARHKRKRKKLHWHIDYLAEEADFFEVIPIRTGDRIECEISSALRKIGEEINGFGSSDCDCPSHLFFMPQSPLNTPPFIKIVQYFRLIRLKNKILCV